MSASESATGRVVNLRSESGKGGFRSLRAYLDDEGSLHIDGHDIGSGTAIISSDGEYEWFQTIEAVDIPRVVQLLGAKADAPILDVLSDWCGPRSTDLERLLRESDIPVSRQVWSS